MKNKKEIFYSNVVLVLIAFLIVCWVFLGILNLFLINYINHKYTFFIFITFFILPLVLLILFYKYFNVYEKRIKEQQIFAESLLNSIEEVITVINREYKIINANKKALKEFGENIIGKNCHEAFHDKIEKCVFCPLEETFSTGKPIVYEREGPNPKVNKIFQITTYPLFDKQQRVEAIIEVVRDITENKKLVQQAFQAEKMASIGLLAAGIAHEIGNPLTSIYSVIQLLQKKINDNFIIEKLDLIKTHIARINKIVKDITSLSRTKETYKKKQLNINMLVKEALGFLKFDTKLKNAEIELILDKQNPQIEGNEQELIQVLLNIILNAADAIKESKQQKIKIITKQDEENIYIIIKDKGIGIDKENLNKVFDPFFTTKEVGKGTGLGLFVSYNIIKKLKGDLRIESEKGKGTEVQIIFSKHS